MSIDPTTTNVLVSHYSHLPGWLDLRTQAQSSHSTEWQALWQSLVTLGSRAVVNFHRRSVCGDPACAASLLPAC